MNDKFQELVKPFEPEHISWLPGATTKDKSKCMVMAYADLRAYMHRLDEVFGCDWSNTVTPWGDKLIVSVTINGVTRSSTGEPDSESIKSGNAGTVTEAQAFKRACAMWGLGRYLYDLPSVWVPFDADNKRIPEAELKQLNKRYSDWYEKQTKAQSQAPKPVMPAGKKSVEGESVTAEGWNADPKTFMDVGSALKWGMDSKVFSHMNHCQNAYDKVKAEKKPETAAAMWALWIQEVNDRVAASKLPQAA